MIDPGKELETATTEVITLLGDKGFDADTICRVLGCAAGLVIANSPDKAGLVATLLGTCIGILTGELLKDGSNTSDD